MPVIDPSLYGLENATSADLDFRMSQILSEINTYPKAHDDPNIPTSLLQELALISGMLRRKTAGPPKTPKRGPAAPPATVADLKNFLLARTRS